MEGRLPPSSAFANSFFEASAEPNVLGVCALSTPHLVTAKFREDEVITGEADITYKIDAIDRKVTDDLIVRNSAKARGYNTSEEIDDLFSRFSANKSARSSFLATNGLGFDYGLILNLIGRLVCAGVAGSDIATLLQGNVNIPSTTALSDHTHRVEAGAIIISRNMAETVGEFNTLLSVLGICNIKSVYTIEDAFPTQGGGLSVNDTVSYLWRLALLILKQAEASGCFVSHVHDLFRGMCHIWSLRGHSDEGGGIREPLRRYSGPMPIGVVAVAPKANEEMLFMGMNLAGRSPIALVRRSVLAFFLDVARCHLDYKNTASDGKVLPVVLSRNTNVLPTETFKDYENFFEHFMDYVRCAYESIAHFFAVANDKVPVSAKSYIYFNARATGLVSTRHFGGDHIAPFEWVEPVGLNSGKGFRKIGTVPGTFGEHDTLPFFSGKNSGRLVGYTVTKKGGPMKGSMVWMDMEVGSSYRESGLHYLLSPRYDPLNGLSGVSFGPTQPGYQTVAMPMFCSQGAANVAQSRWITADNPLPHPMEGIAPSLVRLVMTTTRGVGMPNHNELGGLVTFELGRMSFSPRGLFKQGVSHKEFPSTAKPYLANLNKYMRKVHVTGMDYLDMPVAPSTPAEPYQEYGSSEAKYDGFGPSEIDYGTLSSGSDTRLGMKGPAKIGQPTVVKYAQVKEKDRERKTVDKQKPVPKASSTSQVGAVKSSKPLKTAESTAEEEGPLTVVEEQGVDYDGFLSDAEERLEAEGAASAPATPALVVAEASSEGPSSGGSDQPPPQTSFMKRMVQKAAEMTHATPSKSVIEAKVAGLENTDSPSDVGEELPQVPAGLEVFSQLPQVEDLVDQGHITPEYLLKNRVSPEMVNSIFPTTFGVDLSEIASTPQVSFKPIRDDEYVALTQFHESKVGTGALRVRPTNHPIQYPSYDEADGTWNVPNCHPLYAEAINTLKSGPLPGQWGVRRFLAYCDFAHEHARGNDRLPANVIKNAARYMLTSLDKESELTQAVGLRTAAARMLAGIAQ